VTVKGRDGMAVSRRGCEQCWTRTRQSGAPPVLGGSPDVASTRAAAAPPAVGLPVSDKGGRASAGADAYPRGQSRSSGTAPAVPGRRDRRVAIGLVSRAPARRRKQSRRFVVRMVRAGEPAVASPVIGFTRKHASGRGEAGAPVRGKASAPTGDRRRVLLGERRRLQFARSAAGGVPALEPARGSDGPPASSDSLARRLRALCAGRLPVLGANQSS
jgi:hypothetical protein